MNRQSLRVKIQDEEVQQSSWLAACTSFLKKINPCLRPELQSEGLNSYLEKFVEISIYDDPYYGECFLLESSVENELLVLRKEKYFEHELSQRQKIIRELEAFHGNPHVINEYVVDKIYKVGFLWSKYQCYFTYDYILVDLEKEFRFRAEQRRNFTETEICSVMKGTCKGLIHLQTTEYASVRMSHIYFTKDGMVKVAHPHLFRYRSNLEIMCESDDERGIYLSPEEMTCLERGDKDAILGWKSNAYSFGMIFLSMMRMKENNDIYDFSTCEIDRHRIHELLAQCKEDYSEKLVNIVEKLLLDKPEDRLSLRSVLNKLSYKIESMNQRIDIELLNQNEKDKSFEYIPKDYLVPQKQPEHFNYLSGLVYPKVGRAGEYFNESKIDPYGKKSFGQDDESIIASQRHYYANRNSQYIGGGVSLNRSKFITEGQKQQKPIREGKGVYQNEDGQLYIGEWKRGEMNGYGKLFWNEQKIRYEGYFKDGHFQGQGIQYNGGKEMVGHADDDDTIDQTFVRLQKDNWIKYEGNFREDKRDGQGIAYYKVGKWMGNFKQGQPNGQGIFISNNGVKHKGIWRDGILQQ